MPPHSVSDPVSRSGSDAEGRPIVAAADRWDGVAVGAIALLVAASALVGRRLLHDGVDIFLGFPPLLAHWEPHLGPGTPVALVVAVAIVVWGPRVADGMRWSLLLAVAWIAAATWTVSLALVDGWERGVVGRLTSSQEYLHDVPRVGSVLEMLRTFSDHILTDRRGSGRRRCGRSRLR